MRAMQLLSLKQPLELRQLSEPQLQEGQALIRLQAAALNRRDYWITQGMYPGIVLPMTLGSDGAGLVEQWRGSIENPFGDSPVVINPGWHWGPDPKAQSAEFQILGLPSPGTFAEKVVVPIEYLHPLPPHLTIEQGAALPLAGLTAYRALFVRGGLTPGEKVLVTGAGGGVATLAVQFAVAAGAKVVVTSSQQEKIEKGCNLGASRGWLYTETDWHHQLLSEFGNVDLIVDGAGGSDYAKLMDVVSPGGRIVNYGSTAGMPEKLDLFKVFWKQVNLLGSTMGSPQDFREMLDLVNRHQIVPEVEQVFPWLQVNQALAAMRYCHQFGKIVLRINSD
jgi:zinc-binding alcohol dehydrogenase/oxidoreductase